MRTAIKAGFVILAAVVVAPVQAKKAASAIVAPVQAKTASAKVIKQVEQTFSKVKDYKAEANMSIDSSQMHVKDSKATIYFKRPDKVRVIAKEGFPMIPNEAVPGDPAKWIRDNFVPALEGGGNYKGAPAHVLKLVGKNDRVPTTMRMWVEKRRGLIIGTESNSDGMKVKSDWSYKLVDGKYWLPSQVNVEMSSTTKVRSPENSGHQKPVRGTAVIKITDYKVNKGVPDTVFKRRE